MPRFLAVLAAAAPAFALSLSAGCGSSSSGSGLTGGGAAPGTTSSTASTAATTSTASATTSTASGAGGAGGGACGPDVASPDQVLPGATDPDDGMFTMDQALAGLPEGPGPLRAVIVTDLGTLTCTLRPDVAPIGVANFVGLARGRRAWLDPATSRWVLRRFYDGLLFHRVIPAFVAQGGDPTGTGMGGPGYVFANEIGTLSHVPGTLAYANAGPDTNGSQYYVTETAQPQLDGSYTIFGLCTPVSVVTALTHVPTDANDRPLTDLHMKTVTITRCAP